MIVKIVSLEQWTGRQQADAVYLDVPDTVDIDFFAENNPDKFYYGENHTLLVNKLIELGAKHTANPIKVIIV